MIVPRGRGVGGAATAWSGPRHPQRGRPAGPTRGTPEEELGDFCA
jgi:hypothetical protein